MTTITEEKNVLIISGPINFSTVMDVRTQSLKLFQDKDKIAINLSKMTTFDSSALALLVEWVKYAKASHKIINFSDVPPLLFTLAQISGVNTLIFPN